ncbi:MAG: VCBS repeat-containing protein [Acidobacteria bacterium]|nr:VCBS repeat-containing protein [Acidobacteriota bacterium]
MPIRSRPPTAISFCRRTGTSRCITSASCPAGLPAPRSVRPDAASTSRRSIPTSGRRNAHGYGRPSPGDIPLGGPMPLVQQTLWGDYDGDRKADLTVFRPSTGDWVSLRSLNGMTDYTLRTWGLSSDVPVGRDYDGDGKTDFAIFRPSAGKWLILLSTYSNTAYGEYNWGLSTDVPVPADYNGDGKADIAVYRPSNGTWYVRGLFNRSWGLAGDIPVLRNP